MEIIIGLLIIALGSLGQSSSYVPIKKVKNWSWESFWLVQGIFAWLIIPLLGTILTVPSNYLLEIFKSEEVYKVIFYGALWGIGGLTFGLSMRYLGVALGQSIALGTCAAFGTIFPAIISGTNIFRGDGLIILIGVALTLGGIAIIGYAGSLQSLSKNEKSSNITEFALTKGLIVALLAGVMSACFNLGLEAGKPILDKVISLGVDELVALNPVIMLVTFGGALTNAIYCLYQNKKNNTFSDYRIIYSKDGINNILFCALSGALWYSQFFGLGMGKSYFSESPLMLALSWSILMSFNVIFSNLWGVILKEWKGASKYTIFILAIGMLLLIFSLILPSII